jgi:hypothetical protein
MVVKIAKLPKLLQKPRAATWIKRRGQLPRTHATPVGVPKVAGVTTGRPQKGHA